MAILTKIRNRAGLAVGVVGFALASFIISDAISNNVSIFGGGNNTDIGEIAGKTISYQDLEQKTKDLEADWMKANQKTDADLDQATKEQLRDQAWQEMVEKYTTDVEYEAMGLTVSADELEEMVKGRNPDPMVVQAFKDPQTNMFDPIKVVEFFKTRFDQDPKAHDSWMIFEKGLIKNRISSKYTNMVKAGVYVTSLEAKQTYINRNKSVDFKFVAINYNSMTDSSVKLTDEDYKKYYDAHTYKYKTETARDIKYAVFDILPSSDDSAAVREEVNTFYEKFTTAKNDSEFIAQNSDASIDTNFYGINAEETKLPQTIKDSLFFAPVGRIMGPYMDGNTYKLAKLVSVKDDSVFYAKASHILVQPKGKTPQDSLNAIAEANTLLTEIIGGKKFDDQAREHGTDGTKDKGGDLGWFKQGQMVKEFNDAVIAHANGDMFVVSSQFGAHVVKVTANKTRRLVRIANVERAIEASNATQDQAEKNANNFKSKISNAESFEKAATDLGISLRIGKDVKQGDKNLSGLQNPRELVRWIYENEKGAVSDVTNIDNKFVVALITATRKKGSNNWEDVKDQLEDGTRKMKKAEIFKARFEKEVKGCKTVEELAIKLGTIAQVAPGQTFENRVIPYAGEEMNLLGAIHAMKPGKFSKVIEGGNGVYVAWVDKVNEAQNLPTDWKPMKEELLMGQRSSAEYTTRNAIRDAANIEDMRYKFF
ncbi:MAG: hypothetical protein EXR21_03175 [Flavobacteriaceae bacterium]|nr:hypothetical protein [Flavobacteriaceae bacterium]